MSSAPSADFDFETPAYFNFAHDVVEHHARVGDRTAIIWEDAGGDTASLTYSQVAHDAARLGELLLARGITRGERVIVLLPRIPQWQIAVIACLRIAAVPIPCVEMLSERDLAYRAEDSGARAVICRSTQTAKFRDIASLDVRIAIGEPVCGWVDFDDGLAAMRGDSEPARVAADDPAIMYYTSGSTGHPKGVLHASRAIHAWRYAAMYWLDLCAEDRIWCTADTGWSKAGTSILFGPWSCGACAFFYDGPFDPASRLEMLERHRITIYCAPATELFRVVNEDVARYRLDALRRTVSAGEAMNPIVAARWQAATGTEVAEAYGQTEALMLSLNVAGQPLRLGSMGRPAPGCALDVLDDDGTPAADDAEGRLALKLPNPQMMLGYWNAPERTRETLLAHDTEQWYLTGDRACRDADGYLWFRGRDDDIISSAGYRIGPLEVENVLLEHPAVQECAVVGAPDPERGEIVKAFVVLRDGVCDSDETTRALQQHVKSQTAPYKYPRAVQFVDQLPKTITGKIRRAALRER